MNGQHDSQHMFLELNLISEFVNYGVMIIRYFHCCCHKLSRDIEFSRKIKYDSRKKMIKANTLSVVARKSFFSFLWLEAGSFVWGAMASFWCCPEKLNWKLWGLLKTLSFMAFEGLWRIENNLPQESFRLIFPTGLCFQKSSRG